MTSHHHRAHHRRPTGVGAPPRATGRARPPLPPGQFITALPGLLGFIPEQSFVVVAFDHDRDVLATMRHDLVISADGTVHPAVGAVFDQLGGLCARYGAAGTVIVLADDRFADDDPIYHAVIEQAHMAFAETGGIEAGFIVGEYTEGASWHRIWHAPRWSTDNRAAIRVLRSGEDAGVLGDPHSSATAVAKAVRTGRRVLQRRSEMATMLEPGPHCDAGDAHDSAAGTSTAAVDKAAYLTALLERVRADNNEWDCATVQTLRAAILDLDVRDAAMALSVTDLRDAAERLWRELTCRLRGSGRASAATLLAHLHYVAGEGAYAGVALDCALEADPAWNMAKLLDQAIRGGLRPIEMAEIIDHSFVLGENMGVQMPARTMEPAG